HPPRSRKHYLHISVPSRREKGKPQFRASSAKNFYTPWRMTHARLSAARVVQSASQPRAGEAEPSWLEQANQRSVARKAGQRIHDESAVNRERRDHAGRRL